ncbi:MAG: hypothetical protein HYU75_01820 [Betaproteobacteria bacterium]|nr:hypothetical protein [Betaproteobacteria bacterium]
MSQTTGPDPFEFLKALWSPMGLPMRGMVAPILDVSEIDKRIADLKSVENWLSMNLSVLKMTIQGLEMQRATLAAMQASTAAVAAQVSRPSPGGDPLVDAWRAVLQAQAKQKPEGPDSSKK